MDWKQRLGELKTRLEQERDELRVKAHLAKMDARDEWGGMEGKWAEFKEKLSEIDMDDVSDDVAEAAGRLGEELREGYEKLKKKID